MGRIIIMNLEKLVRGVAIGIIGLVSLLPVYSTAQSIEKAPQQKQGDSNQNKDNSAMPEEYRRLEEEVLDVVERYATRKNERKIVLDKKRSNLSRQIYSGEGVRIEAEYKAESLIKLNFCFWGDEFTNLGFEATKQEDSWKFLLGKEKLRRMDKTYSEVKALCYEKPNVQIIEIKSKPISPEPEYDVVKSLEAGRKNLERLVFLVRQFEKNCKP